MKPETIKDLLVINRIAGLLEGLAAMEGAPISRKAAILLEDAADRLMMYVSDEYTKDVAFDEEEIFVLAHPRSISAPADACASARRRAKSSTWKTDSPTTKTATKGDNHMSITDIILCGISGILGIGVIIGAGLILIGAVYLSKEEGTQP